MSDDLISRRELRKEFKKCPVFTEVYLHYARQLIDNAPTVDLVSPIIKANTSEEIKQKLIEELQKSHKSLVLCERRTGEWKVVSNGTTNHYACSKCGHAGDFQDKFCRWCGADMRKEGEE